MTTVRNLPGLLASKMLRGIAVVIMLGLYGAGMLGITTAASVATSTEANAYRGRRGWRGRRGYRGRRGWWRGRRGRGRRGWRGRRGYYPYYGPGIYLRF
jgi:hypothetical protein